MIPRILALAGSLRKDSFNKKLVPIAAHGARKAGAEVTILDLKDFPLPLFDKDLEAEQGMPKNGQKLKHFFIEHDGLLIASPEYNSSITGVLKNAIDWVSRPAPGEPPLVAFRRKVACLMSASPGALEAFGPDGSLIDAKQQAAIEGLGSTLGSFLSKLKN
jgi:NAD(P)H-dependent FMN reductase